MNGNRSKREIGEKNNPTIARRLNVANSFNSTYGPTPMQKRSLEIAATEFKELKKNRENIINMELPKIEDALKAAGAP